MVSRRQTSHPCSPLHRCEIEALSEGAGGELWLATNRGLYALHPATGALRHYGPDDVSGHLRRYSLAEGLALVERAGLEVLAQSQVWVHETPAEAARRALRRERLGAAFAGAWPARGVRRAVFATATAVRPLGRRLFASNLFVAARAQTARPAKPVASRPPR